MKPEEGPGSRMCNEAKPMRSRHERYHEVEQSRLTCGQSRLRRLPRVLSQHVGQYERGRTCHWGREDESGPAHARRTTGRTADLTWLHGPPSSWVSVRAVPF
jgi:hypothetical protein